MRIATALAKEITQASPHRRQQSYRFRLYGIILILNDHELVADDLSCVTTILAVAAGELDEPTFAV